MRISIPIVRTLQTLRSRIQYPFGMLPWVSLAQIRYFVAVAEEGNVGRAAELLGLERSHLYRKMKALGIGVRE